VTGSESAQVAGLDRPVRLLGRAPALDGLRAIAVLLVVFFHARLTKIGIPRDNPLDELIRGGFLGVDLFFVLSGFLITALLLREQAEQDRVRIRHFYGRRVLRLLPALYLVLFAHALFVYLVDFRIEGGARAELATLTSSVLYYANWHTLMQEHVGLAGLGHLWSLSIEEQFYFVWPLLLALFFGLRRNAAMVVSMLGIVIVGVCIHRAFLWNSYGWGDAYYRTDVRVDGLLIGALLAWLWVRNLTPRRGLSTAAWIASAVIVVCTLSARPSTGFWNGTGFTVVALATAVIILAAMDSNWPVNRFLSLAPMVAVGRVSYGIYLWHFPVFWAVGRWGRDLPAPVRCSLAFGLTALFTVASWTLLERPVMRLRRRFETPRAALPAPAPGAPAVG
jgi:peptidoglycan/LPS O-acetylase OafA/YrhL